VDAATLWYGGRHLLLLILVISGCVVFLKSGNWRGFCDTSSGGIGFTITRQSTRGVFRYDLSARTADSLRQDPLRSCCTVTRPAITDRVDRLPGPGLQPLNRKGLPLILEEAKVPVPDLGENEESLKSFCVWRCLKSYQPSKHTAHKRISSEHHFPTWVCQMQEADQPTSR
jgi:hypothetical protein